MPKLAGKDLTGNKIGRLAVIGEAERSKRNHIQYWCRCECGAEKIIAKGALVSGDTKSCGCIRRENSNELTSFLRLRCSDDLFALAERAAESAGTTLSEYIRWAVLDRVEADGFKVRNK